MNKQDFTGRYMSTYSFVGNNKLEKKADEVFGKGWEAEDDANQIQILCDAISKNEYSVSILIDCKYENDILVIKKEPETEVEAELHAKVEWYNLFVDYIYEIDSNKYNEACEYADNNQFKT